MTEAFSRVGIGGLLGDMFDRAATSRTGAFPDVERRGETLLMVADFGGQHKGQHFDTYAFLILDLDRNEHWLTGQRAFRRTVLPSSRRMSFKTMNDGQRRRALLPFLRLADRIEGWLVLFAVSKVGGSLFSRNDSTQSKDLLASWKPRVRERLLRIIHLSAFLLSGLSSPGQDLLWLIDKDEIASNSDQLRQLTAVFGRVSSSLLNHDLRHIKCGTTQSEDGTLSLEDLVAVSDLAAGAFAEVTTAMSIQGGLPRRGLVTALLDRFDMEKQHTRNVAGSKEPAIAAFELFVGTQQHLVVDARHDDAVARNAWATLVAPPLVEPLDPGCISRVEFT